MDPTHDQLWVRHRDSGTGKVKRNTPVPGYAAHSLLGIKSKHSSKGARNGAVQKDAGIVRAQKYCAEELASY